MLSEQYGQEIQQILAGVGYHPAHAYFGPGHQDCGENKYVLWPAHSCYQLVLHRLYREQRYGVWYAGNA